MTQRIDNPAERFFDESGNVLAFGKMDFYSPLTTEVKETFADPNMAVENDPVVTLDEYGVIPDVFIEGSYKGRLRSYGNVQKWNRDFINPYNLAPFDEWSSGVIYSFGGNNIVTWNGKYYVSTSDDNLDNDPETNPDEWEEVSFLPTGNDAAARIGEIGAITPEFQKMVVADISGWGSLPLSEIFRGYLTGLETSNAADINHDITVSAGACTDSDNEVMMSIASPITKRIDATWAEGTGNGGLAIGAVITSVWVHLFVIRTASTIDVMFDSSVVCANGVASNGVLNFRRIGSVLTDGSQNITPYFQIGDYFYWDGRGGDVVVGSPGDAAVTATLSVPTGVIVTAYVSVVFAYNLLETGTKYFLLSALEQTDSTPGAAIFDMKALLNTADSQAFTNMLMVKTNTSSQVRYRFTNAQVADFILRTFGWIDSRGQ